MVCSNCKSGRLILICGKTSDLFSMRYKDKVYDGYVPSDLNIGSGDYIEFSYCLNCGKIQDDFPVKESIVNKSFRDSE